MAWNNNLTEFIVEYFVGGGSDRDTITTHRGIPGTQTTKKYI